jgi:hypothetical protein
LGRGRLERRLSAILAADVAGYSRLMGADEESTHAQLMSHVRTLIKPKIAEYRGRVVKNTGDGMLVEFSSVVDALRCAVEVQRGMAARNAEGPDDKRIEFRIGINIGDVIVEKNDIYGDGVNIAARLERFACFGNNDDSAPILLTRGRSAPGGRNKLVFVRQGKQRNSEGTEMLALHCFRILHSCAFSMCRWLKISLFDSYRSELHHMRGPGPKWGETHARSAEFASLDPEQELDL